MAKSKLTIDKENMFNKIMPSSAKKDEDTNSVTENSPPSEQNVSVPPVITAISHPKPKIFDPDRQVEIFNPRKGTIMINVMERLVIQKLDAAIQKFNNCKCDRCRQDIAAMALSNLPAKYVVINPEDVDSYIAKQDDAEVTSAILRAIFAIRTHPRH
jgi:glucose/arabinose dehydrogenase